MTAETHRAAVLLVGCAHLANRGRDVFNTEFDDMLAPRRQAELREVAARLARFAPTKVAIEVDAGRDGWLNERYRGYRAGTAALTADEVDQLGLRVAGDMGHERVHAIDWNEPIGEGMGPAFAFAERHQPELYEELILRPRREQETASERARATPVLEMLRQLNDPESLRQSHRTYLTMARIGRGKEYPGVDWVQGWYGRNLRIFVNLTRIVASPEERVLVVYGAAHIPLLAQFIGDSGLHDLGAAATYLG